MTSESRPELHLQRLSLHPQILRRLMMFLSLEFSQRERSWQLRCPNVLMGEDALTLKLLRVKAQGLA
jgi:hypothetical protein